MSLFVDIYKRVGNFTLDMQLTLSDQPIAIIGASGSGKSMLLRCIAGIEKPDKGKMTYDNICWYDSTKRICLPPQKRHAGYLFQQYALFENMTVRENILSGMTGSKAEKHQLCDTLLEQFQLTDVGKHRPAQLSGGQKQRTALARMLAAKPEVLLLDEPFSALDSFLRDQVHRQMAEVLEKHSGTSILVTHDFQEAVQLCPRAAVVADGKIVEQDFCMELWHNPKTRAAAELTGMRNFIALPERMTEKGISIIGIRPQHFRLAQPSDRFRLDGVVKRLLPGISFLQAELETAYGIIIWDVPNYSMDKPQKGQQLQLSAEENNIHFLYS